jgi:hypothetical protein
MDTEGLRGKKEENTIPIIFITSACSLPKKTTMWNIQEIQHPEDQNPMCAFQKVPFQRIFQYTEMEN